ncbi:MAG: NUDIX hydrolase [Acidobacteria bacterium]|nr:NUDIX hydrolase [Acidobacteriota bacterium]
MKRRVVGVVLLRPDGAALLQHRDDKPGLRHGGVWVMPGGHCDPGEPLDAGARRELREETDYDCDELHWLSSFADDEDPDCLCTMFWGRYDGRQPVQCREGQALQFVTREQAASYPMPAYLVDLWDMALAAAMKTTSSSTK